MQDKSRHLICSSKKDFIKIQELQYNQFWTLESIAARSFRGLWVNLNIIILFFHASISLFPWQFYYFYVILFPPLRLSFISVRKQHKIKNLKRVFIKFHSIYVEDFFSHASDVCRFRNHFWEGLTWRQVSSVIFGIRKTFNTSKNKIENFRLMIVTNECPSSIMAILMLLDI